VEVDALSQFTDGQLTVWAAGVIVLCSPLKNCTICLLPPALLVTLAALSSCKPTEGTYDKLTTALLTHDLNIYDPATLLQKRIYMHPYLHELILQRAVWTKLKLQKEVYIYIYIYCMLATQAQYLQPLAGNPMTTFLGKQYAVWDWAQLDIFTRSCSHSFSVVVRRPSRIELD
jgi:hypothetical protein